MNKFYSVFAALLISNILSTSAFSEDKIILNVPIKLHDIMDEMEFVQVRCHIQSNESRPLNPDDKVVIGGGRTERLPMIGPKMDIVVRIETRPMEGKSFTNAERYSCFLLVGSTQYPTGMGSRDERGPDIKDATGEPKLDWYAAKPGTPFVRIVEGDLSSKIRQMLQTPTDLTIAN